MSDILTSISVPGAPNGWGFKDWGVKTAEEMIAIYRSRAAYLRKQVEAIEQTKDADFQISVVRGVHVEKLVRVIQPVSQIARLGGDGV